MRLFLTKIGTKTIVLCSISRFFKTITWCAAVDCQLTAGVISANLEERTKTKGGSAHQ